MSYLIQINNIDTVEDILHRLIVNQEINEEDLDQFYQIDNNTFIGNNEMIYQTLSLLPDDCHCEADDEIEIDTNNLPTQSLLDWYSNIRNTLIESDIFNNG